MPLEFHLIDWKDIKGNSESCYPLSLLETQRLYSLKIYGVYKYMHPLLNKEKYWEFPSLELLWLNLLKISEKSNL